MGFLNNLNPFRGSGRIISQYKTWKDFKKNIRVQFHDSETNNRSSNIQKLIPNQEFKNDDNIKVNATGYFFENKHMSDVYENAIHQTIREEGISNRGAWEDKWFDKLKDKIKKNKGYEYTFIRAFFDNILKEYKETFESRIRVYQGSLEMYKTRVLQKDGLRRRAAMDAGEKYAIEFPNAFQVRLKHGDKWIELEDTESYKNYRKVKNEEFRKIMEKRNREKERRRQYWAGASGSSTNSVGYVPKVYTSTMPHSWEIKHRLRDEGRIAVW